MQQPDQIIFYREKPNADGKTIDALVQKLEASANKLLAFTQTPKKDSNEVEWIKDEKFNAKDLAEPVYDFDYSCSVHYHWDDKQKLLGRQFPDGQKQIFKFDNTKDNKHWKVVEDEKITLEWPAEINWPLLAPRNIRFSQFNRSPLLPAQIEERKDTLDKALEKNEERLSTHTESLTKLTQTINNLPKVDQLSNRDVGALQNAHAQVTATSASLYTFQRFLMAQQALVGSYLTALPEKKEKEDAYADLRAGLQSQLDTYEKMIKKVATTAHRLEKETSTHIDKLIENTPEKFLRFIVKDTLVTAPKDGIMVQTGDITKGAELRWNAVGAQKSFDILMPSKNAVGQQHKVVRTGNKYHIPPGIPSAVLPFLLATIDLNCSNSGLLPIRMAAKHTPENNAQVQELALLFFVLLKSRGIENPERHIFHNNQPYFNEHMPTDKQIKDYTIKLKSFEIKVDKKLVQRVDPLLTPAATQLGKANEKLDEEVASAGTSPVA